MVELSFGEYIRDLRKQLRLTQRDLASRVGIDVGYISKIEAEKVPPPSEKVIERLASVLGADKDQLMILAGKAPRDLQTIITRDARIPAILRRAKGLSPQEWKKVEEYVERLKTNKRGN
jgi:transcriptional regulator with XRE-family HTH domain